MVQLGYLENGIQSYNHWPFPDNPITIMVYIINGNDYAWCHSIDHWPILSIPKVCTSTSITTTIHQTGMAQFTLVPHGFIACYRGAPSFLPCTGPRPASPHSSATFAFTARAVQRSHKPSIWRASSQTRAFFGGPATGIKTREAAVKTKSNVVQHLKTVYWHECQSCFVEFCWPTVEWEWDCETM